MKSSTDNLLLQFKALADPVRTRLVALCGVAECSVSELTKVTGQSQPRISQHVKQLCAVNLLERFKDGHFVYYRVRSVGEDSATRVGIGVGCFPIRHTLLLPIRPEILDAPAWLLIMRAGE